MRHATKIFLRFACCELLPLSRWDSGILFYLGLVPLLFAKQLLFWHAGVRMPDVLVLVHYWASTICLYKVLVRLFTLRQDNLAGLDHSWSGTPFLGYLGLRGKFSLLCVEPVAALVGAWLMIGFSSGTGRTVPLLITPILAYFGESPPSWLNLAFLPMLPIVWLGNLLRPLVQDYTLLIAVLLPYATALLLWPHNACEVAEDARLEHPEAAQAEPEPNPEPIRFHTVKA